MENKFTRGIQERQQRNNSSETLPQKTPQTPHEEDHSFLKLEDYIEKTPSRKAKNKTFYLDGTVLDALKNAAEKQQIAESKLVNDILKKVLLSTKNH